MELEIVQNKIYEIRGHRVMLDFDLARLYRVETRRLNESVKRNMKHFPTDFMFQLTSQEFTNLMSHFATSSWGGTRKLPYAFTEQGVAMLSGLLNSDIAIEVNISIMRAFVAMRRLAMFSAELQKLALENADIRRSLEEFMAETEEKFDDIYVALSEMAVRNQKSAEKPRTPIGYRQ